LEVWLWSIVFSTLVKGKGDCYGLSNFRVTNRAEMEKMQFIPEVPSQMTAGGK